MINLKYRVECVFSPLDSGFDLTLDRVFSCPFPCSFPEEYFADFIYGLICDADEQLSDLYGKDVRYYLSSLSFNSIEEVYSH